MDRKIIFIPIIIAIGITAFVSSISTNQVEQIDDEKVIIEKNLEIEEEKIKTDEEIFNEINEKYKEIEEKSNSSEYIPKEREWQSSGPFKIDRKEYALGEKIFMTTENLRVDESGEIVILHVLNQTHLKIWNKYQFDGNIKPTFGVYFEPRISKTVGICDKYDLIGDWVVHFRGTVYPDLKFSINEEIIPGDELDFSKVVC